MTKDDDLGPFKGLVTAGTALLSMGAFVMTKWVGFLASPPPLHYGEKETFWLALATICCGVVCALIFLFLPWKKKTAAKLQVVLGILTLLALIVFVVVSIAYNRQKSKWTFTFQGEWVLIGDRYTDAARVDSRIPGINKDILFKDFGEKSTDVWTSVLVTNTIRPSFHFYAIPSIFPRAQDHSRRYHSGSAPVLRKYACTSRQRTSNCGC